MSERRDILALRAQTGSQPAVLVTLAAVSGSSYRRPGARLLLLADGRRAGTISGGCLEAEIARTAQWHTSQGAALRRYSTQFDDPDYIPFGLGCGGTLDLLFEPVHSPEAAALLDALAATLDGHSRTVITRLPADSTPLARLVLDASGNTLFASATLSPAEIATLSSAANTPSPEQGSGLFIEHLHPPQRLILFGAGDDAQPLAQMAALLGWSVIVADGRSHLAQPARFPTAQVVALNDSLDITPLALTPADAVVLLTHSYAQDCALLPPLLTLAPRYLALLGSRRRAALLLSQAAATLGRSMDELAPLLHAPAGLDLGNDSPASVALAILAEAHARCHSASAEPLRLSAAQLWQYLEDAIREGTPPLVCALDSPLAPAAGVKP